MIELNKGEYKIVETIMNDNMDHIEVRSVLSGMNPGWVFVDDKNNLKTALVWSQGIKGFYFIGDYTNKGFIEEVDTFIQKNIKSRIEEKGLKYFEFSGDSENWESVFKSIFRNRDLQWAAQLIYKLNDHKWELYKERTLPKDYSLRKIDKELFNDYNIKNIEYLESEIQLWWDSVEKYLSCNLGYCIVKEDEIVSFCMCDYVNENLRPLGIMTKEEHRRKGLCEVETSAYIKECMDRGLRPYWDCMGSNIPSQSLAEKLGLEKVWKYNVFWFTLN